MFKQHSESVVLSYFALRKNSTKFIEKQTKYDIFPFAPPFQTTDFVINYKALMELPILI